MRKCIQYVYVCVYAYVYVSLPPVDVVGGVAGGGAGGEPWTRKTGPYIHIQIHHILIYIYLYIYTSYIYMYKYTLYIYIKSHIHIHTIWVWLTPGSKHHFFPWFLSASLIPDVQLALVLLRRRIRSVDLHLRCRMWPAAGSRPWKHMICLVING